MSAALLNCTSLLNTHDSELMAAAFPGKSIAAWGECYLDDVSADDLHRSTVDQRLSDWWQLFLEFASSGHEIIIVLPNDLDPEVRDWIMRRIDPHTVTVVKRSEVA